MQHAAYLGLIKLGRGFIICDLTLANYNGVIIPNAFSVVRTERRDVADYGEE